MREYEIHVGGLPHTIQLDEATAKARGLKPAAKPPATKARTRVRNKAV